MSLETWCLGPILPKSSWLQSTNVFVFVDIVGTKKASVPSIFGGQVGDILLVKKDDWAGGTVFGSIPGFLMDNLWIKACDATWKV